MPHFPMSRMGRVFATAAFIEALTWTGLLIGMVPKYGTGTTDVGVWLFGRLHGLAFLGYLGVVLVTATRLRWPAWALLVGLLAAVPPMLTVPLEWWYRKRGLLSKVASENTAV